MLVSPRCIAVDQLFDPEPERKTDGHEEPDDFLDRHLSPHRGSILEPFL